MVDDFSRRIMAGLATLLVAGAPAVASGEACDGAPGAATTADLPSEEELERQGALVRSIQIEVQDVFDPSQPGESAAPYRWANELHVRTRDDVIRAQLLFRESEPYSQRKVAETERLLRQRRYLFDAWIEPTCYDPAAGTVDLRVRVRDVWSLNPGFRFSRKGGTNDAAFQLEDQDFLGRGELVAAAIGSNVDRKTLLLRFQDPQLFGSWWKGGVAYADNSDGTLGELGVERPFYSLDTRWGLGVGMASGDRVDSRYQRGEVLDKYTEGIDRFEVYGGRSAGLRDGWARRWLAGVRVERSEFDLLPDEALVAGLPADRSLAYPWLGLEWIEDDFVTARNQDQLARTEDLQFGRTVRVELGLASPAWGADRTAGILALSGNAGQRLGEGGSLFVSGGLSGRLEGQGLRDALLQGEARYYHRQSPRRLFFTSARGAMVVEPDLDHQLLLGGDTGLRGYPLRYQSGTASALLTAEERFYTDWNPFRLFHIGGAVFADVGRTWGRDVTGEVPLGWLANAGVGLRIGNARSGLGNVVHLDVAVPLVRQPGMDSVQFLIETKRSF